MIQVGRSCGVLFSGNANNGVNCGFGYANSNNVPSNMNANIGSHLCLKIGSKEKYKNNTNGTTTLPLGKKNQVTLKVLVGTPVVWATEDSD